MPAPPAALPRERHPALRPRLGDIAEEDLRAFSAREGSGDAAEPMSPEPCSQEPAHPAAPDAAEGARVEAAPRGRRARAAGGRPSQRQGRLNLKRFTLLVLLPCALAGSAGWAMTTPRMAVSAVEVSGLQATPDALVQPISQALLGQNWLRVNMEAAHARLEELPTVQAATVTRAWDHWPPRLKVQIQERKPWVRLGGGATWWVVDGEGVAFRRATRDDQALYAITSTTFDAEAAHVGQPVPLKVWEGVRRLGLALDESSRQGGPWQLRRAYLDRDNMASLRLKGGGQDELLVRLGDGLWPQKMERARRALAFFEAAGRRAASLNLVSFSMPTWTPLQPPKPALNADSQASRDTSAPRAQPARTASADASIEDSTTPPDSTGTPPTPSASTSATRSHSKRGARSQREVEAKDSARDSQSAAPDSAPSDSAD